MTAKPRPKKKSGKNGDLKATTIIIIVILLGGLTVWLLNRFQQTKTPKKVQSTVVTPKKVVKPIKPVVKEPVKPPVKVIPKKPVPVTNIGNGAKIAFVLDDWGYTMGNCAILSEIKQPLAIAVLPSLRHTNNIIKCADRANKTIMLHLPMQPYLNRDPYPANYLLTTTMSPNKVEAILEEILLKMPRIEGVNNHMGSKAMEDKRLLKLVFRHLKQRQLFFVDSMTSPKKSMGDDVAKEIGLPFGQRDVFLDNINTREAILKQFDELRMKASKKGYAIAIGHDRGLTMRIIKEQAPILEAQGFEIVSVKELLRNK